MTVIGNEMIEEIDPRQMADELAELQQRLDTLAREGTNPYEIKRLQHVLDAARAEFDDLFAVQSAV
ncbi:MAG: hypothetical protein WD080_03445 [Egibacteraceae bacterium]